MGSFRKKHMFSAVPSFFLVRYSNVNVRVSFYETYVYYTTPCATTLTPTNLPTSGKWSTSPLSSLRPRIAGLANGLLDGRVEHVKLLLNDVQHFDRMVGDRARQRDLLVDLLWWQRGKHF